MPGKRKNPNDAWLPPRVYKHRSSYIWKPTDKKSLKLCSTDDPKSKVWECYEKAIKGDKYTDTVEDMINKYFNSLQYKKKSPRTQRDEITYSKPIIKVFGKMHPNNVKITQIRKYMDVRGATSEIMANKEKKFLSFAYKWAVQRGHAEANPCKGVDNFVLPTRKKYIEDIEYYQVLKLSPTIIKIFMEIAYLCAARGQDIRVLKNDDLRYSGLFIYQQKTGKKQIKRWTNRLTDAINLAQQLKRQREEDKSRSPWLIPTTKGTEYTDEGLKTLWQKNKQMLKLKHDIDITFTFHDIKAKGISDYDGDKRKFSGHKTNSMMEVYNRNVEIVDSIDSNKRVLAVDLLQTSSTEIK